MKNNEILKSIFKYMPIYLVALIFLLILQYTNSLTALFVGEVLGIFEGSDHVLPDFLVNFLDTSSTKEMILSVAIIYIIISSIGIISNFLSRYIRILYVQFLTIDLGKSNT